MRVGNGSGIGSGIEMQREREKKFKEKIREEIKTIPNTILVAIEWRTKPKTQKYIICQVFLSLLSQFLLSSSSLNIGRRK